MEKTYQNLLRYSLFLAVLLERIRDFLLRYFYLSGTITYISIPQFLAFIFFPFILRYILTLVYRS